MFWCNAILVLNVYMKCFEAGLRTFSPRYVLCVCIQTFWCTRIWCVWEKCYKIFFWLCKSALFPYRRAIRPRFDLADLAKCRRVSGLRGVTVKFNGNLHRKMEEKACKNYTFWAIGMVTKYRIFRIGFGLGFFCVELMQI